MNLRVWIACLCTLSALLLVLLLTGFPGRHVGGAPGSVSAAGLSRAAAQQSATLITTSASSHRVLSNSAVDISVGVQTSARDIATAQRALATRSTSLVNYLKGQGVEHLITDAVSFTPDIRDSRKGPDHTVGYDAALTVSFRTTPEKAGDLLAGVLSNGANSIQSTVFTPTEEQIASAHDALAEEATRNALAEAESVAKAGGEHVLAVISVGTQAPAIASNSPVMFDDRAMAKAAPGIATAAGDREVTVTVEVVVAAARE